MYFTISIIWENFFEAVSLFAKDIDSVLRKYNENTVEYPFSLGQKVF